MNRVTAMGPIAGFHLRRRRCAAVAVVAVSLGAISLVPAAARADSIVYEKGGNIWLSSPDGARSVQVTASGGYSRPAQADDGTIIAVKDKLLQRLTRTGGILNLAGASDYTGPQTPSISPNGALVAYQFFATGPILTGFHVAFSRSDRPTPNYEITDTLGGYINPAFLDDGRVVIFEPDRTVDTQIWTPSGTVQDWFSEPDADLGGGEADRGLTRFAAVAGSATSIRIYRLNSPPPAAPELRCVVTGAAGTFFRPTWSPDGRSLAWQEDDGIHVMPVDLDNCAGTSRLVIPGGQAPDWGPADLPASAGPGAAGDTTPPRTTATLPSTIGRAALGRGIRVRVSCSEACTVTLTLRTAGAASRVVGKATSAIAANRRVVMTIRPSRKARAALRAGRVHRLVLLVASRDAAGNRAPAVVHRVTLARR